MEAAEFQRHARDGVERLVMKLEDAIRQAQEMRNNLLKQAGISVEPDKLVVERDLEVRGGGSATVADGGHLRVRYPDDLGGRTGITFGRIVNEATGEYQGTGLLSQAPDGPDIFVARTDETGNDHVFQVRDNEGNSVFGLWPGVDRGLARPTLSIPMHATYWRAWSSTDSSNWTDVARGGTRLWHQRIWASCRATSDEVGTAGQLRLVLEGDGSEHQIGASGEVGFAITNHVFNSLVPSALPIGGWVNFRLQARVTAGSGRVHGVANYVEMQS